MTRHVIEAEAEVVFQDDGRAVIAEVADPSNEVYVQIKEWVEDPSEFVFAHTLNKKRVRVTIEVIE